jgi:uncharacterized membrane protein YczE
MNNTPLEIFKNALLAAFGLFSFGFGLYLTIQANVGVAPWDTLTLGIADTLGVLYGNVSVVMGFVILGIDLLMGEKIGIGSLLDAVIVGKTGDFFNWLNLFEPFENTWAGIALLMIGFFIMGFSQYLYMKAGLCCGPKDSLMVGIGRRLHKISIGTVNILITIVVLVLGWRLGGPIGIGTLIGTVAIGAMMQLAFNLVNFEPKNVVHQNIIESIKVLTGKGQQEGAI